MTLLEWVLLIVAVLIVLALIASLLDLEGETLELALELVD